MNLAPPGYDEEFYKREIEGMKFRLEKLKVRRSIRQNKLSYLREDGKGRERSHASRGPGQAGGSGSGGGCGGGGGGSGGGGE